MLLSSAHEYFLLNLAKIAKIPAMGNNNKQNKKTPGTSKGEAKIMLGTILSTTLRIFIPITILFCIGLAIDLNAGTKPWGMIIDTGLGIILSIVLVIWQVKRIRLEGK